MSNGRNNSGVGLNEFQARHLKVACQHIDKLLTDMEEVLHSSESKSVFPRYVPELAPVQRKTIEDYTARLRSQLLRALSSQRIDAEPSRIGEAHALHTLLTFVEIALEELTPEDMAGYGAVAPEAVTDLKGIAQELMATVAEMHAYVMQRSRHDIDERLRKLRGSNGLVEALGTVQRIISRYGLVEFRPRLIMLLDLLENKGFEIGMFGRVSSGKSSLLNHAIGQDVLPVGVTPITAVPTRIRYADDSRLLVFRDNASSGEFPISEIGSFVDERQNPANAKRVSRIVLKLPAESLKNGLVFVDTPGLGSLATSGAAETLAYLPRCDYGIILIDAAGTLTDEDLRTVEALKAASIPVSVLISKADLADEEDLRRLMGYVSQHVIQETGFSVPVHAVSVLSSHRYLLEEWLREEIGPMHGRVAELKEQSLSRKCEALVQSVLDTLNNQVAPSGSGKSAKATETAEATLRHTSGSIEDSRREVAGLIRNLPLQARGAIEAASVELTGVWMAGRPGSLSPLNEMLTHEANAIAAACYRTFKELADNLHNRLEEVSLALVGKSAPIENFRFQELPIFEASLEDASFPKPSFAVFGRTVLRSLAHRRLNQFHKPAEDAFNAYSNQLQGWAQLALHDVERQYESYAQELRTQAQRLATGMVAPVAESELRSDIDAFEGAIAFEEVRPASGM